MLPRGDTLAGTLMADGRMVVELYCESTAETITRVTVPGGDHVVLTGAIDLPVGEHDICIRLYPEELDGSGDWSDANLQVILGQAVEVRGCPNACEGGSV